MKRIYGNHILIDWKQEKDQTWTGYDTDGNRYRQGALRETTSVTLTDGREGYGWEPEDAYQKAQKQEL